ncbi:restriction endonuclease subunit S [Vibrio parahaemolyticus]|uniref:Restriction endonuclease subunit S n=1 Tax=Vibrio parahaemolyticus TaxID=670 RepID=A0A7Z2MQ36_VIBPH|nr:restriction endonuclease subunit S [Vibrio parahaemolyticus]QHH08250.1 restriction endonuclease subunit S [Vibrio parahaemolyticus]UJX08911.1 restriction endonuclease subunit S [Vibrio parahaemolyticus]HAS6672503.1 restriction endonuclease subunit S [Vibrio parahaemolyticus]HAS6678356.1 restriction endonuclease subunit S [Vibrio parahaemolyticus]HAV1493476.1 restriction endonuclease subunit S [Vibrio parahaemolyticus]
MAVENLITEHIDIWTSSVKTKSTSGRGSSKKQELYGVKKLRELILELAVRGKLVPQDPNDEPASVLLDRIAEEKKKLIENKKLRKSKDLSVISEKDTPYRIPSTWKWCYLSDLGSIIGGGTPKSNEDVYWTDKGVKWLTPADLYGLKSKYIGSGKRDITNLGLEKSSAQLLPKGSVLFSSRAPIGYVAITSNELATNQGFKSVVPIFQELSEYIYYFLKRSGKFIDAEASGTTFKEVSGTVVSKVLTPLPPIAEQHRIVAKVDELMALCDQLEQQTEASIEAHQVLVTTLLDTLTNSADADELMQNWAKISEHFDTLFTTEESIDQLKQTILQLAVMGKLVPQDPSDEPAAELLKRIAEEKAQLVKEKKIKKEKALPPIAEDEKPFELPNGWEWCRLEDVVDIQSGITKGRKLAGRELKTIPYLSVANVQRGYLILNNVKEIDLPIDELEKYSVEDGDLLITEGGDWDKVGRTAIWRSEVPYMAHQNHVFKARPFLKEQSEAWLEMYLNGPFARKYFAGSSKQTTNLASINKTQLRSCLIAVPPRDEKKEISDRVQELIGMCDLLLEGIRASLQTQLQLTDVIVDQAV